MMNAPLSRYLVRFGEEGTSNIEPMPGEPILALTAAELDGQLQLARQDAHERAEQDLRRHIETLTAREVENAKALEQQRADWCQQEAAALAKAVEEGLRDLKDGLSARICDILLPLVRNLIAARAREAVADAIDCIVSDPKHPPLTVRAPTDVVRALRSSGRLPDGVELVEAETIEATVSFEGMDIETRLSAAFAALDGAAR